MLPIFDSHAIDLLLLDHPVHLRYFAGFSGSEGALLLSREGGQLLVDSRYTIQARNEAVGLTVVEQSQRLEGVAEQIRSAGCKRLGFDALHTTVQTHTRLSELLSGVQLIAFGAELEQVRSCKDLSEIEQLEQVAVVGSRAFESVLCMIRPGVVEAELALQLEFEMRKRGADGRGFDFIVASGSRGAMPHGRASGKQVQSGELVTFDFGAVMNGYHSDETVTVAVGAISKEHLNIYNTVLAAHDLAIEAVRPGVPCRDIDAVARDYITQQGYGDYFGHGLGHGVGLEIHEKPVISPSSDALVAEGMVFTIEPGIYIPGLGGVRIEDTIVVTADGCRLLTRFPKELQRL